MGTDGTSAFGGLLRRHRIAAALSQEELAERAGLSLRGVSDLERGARRAPRLETVRRLADALGLDDAARAVLLAAREGAPAEPPSTTPAPGVDRPALPIPPTPMIGRDREAAEVADLLLGPDVRLVTMTGPGGVGKTRLALRVAEMTEARFADGVAFVALGPLGDPALVLPAIALALGLREGSGRAPLDAVRAFLGPRELLLVLDNVEHLLASAEQIGELVRSCPRLTVLITSRERLRLSGERTYPVAPLPLPERSAATPEALTDSPAVRLFVERARAVDPAVNLSPEHLAAMAEICRRVDGLPLAIELAAARVDVLPPAAMLARLERRLPLLVGGARDAPARQQTMRSTIAWGYDLLATEERRLFRRLAAFVGGCTIEAAEAVAGEPGDDGIGVLDGVASLVRKSLLRAEDDPGGEPRYRMLETVREFAQERLAASGEETSVRERHAAHVLAVVERVGGDVFGPGKRRGMLDRLDPEHANLQAALGWFAATGDATRELRLAGSLGEYWFASGRLREGMANTEAALGRGGAAPPGLRAGVMALISYLCGEAGEGERSLAFSTASVPLARAAGDPQLLTSVLFNHGLALRWGGNLDEAVVVLGEAFSLGGGLDPPPASLGMIQGNLGTALMDRGERERGLAIVGEALAWYRARGMDSIASLLLARLGYVAQVGGDPALAAARYGESLRLMWADGLATHFDRSLVGLAGLAADRGEAAAAARLLGAVKAVQERTGATDLIWPHVRDHAARVARAALGDEAYARAFAAGRHLSPREVEVEALALADSIASAAPSPGQPVTATAGLSRRELEVLRLIAAGRSNRQIADELAVSRRTATTHATNILNKLGLDSRAELIAFAFRRGLA